MTRAIEQSLHAQMQAAQDLERKARETLLQAERAHIAARRSYMQARLKWLHAADQLEAQPAAPILAFAPGGAR